MSMKINTKTQNKRNSKKKSNKKKLFFIFFGSFMVFFFICTLAASLLTPNIDVPALKDDPNLDSLTSEDFKGRIDSRLRSIELQEETGPLTADTDSPFKVKDPDNKLTEDTTVDNQNPDVITDETEFSQSEEEFDQVPYNGNDANNIQEPSPKQYQTSQNKAKQPQPVTKYPAVSKPQPVTPQNNLMLRDKIQVERNSISMNKVIIGSYSSPGEAKRITEELMSSNLNVTPFIKEVNGSYTLQVGSFSNQQKAEILVNELKKRNMPAKIIQE